MFVCSFLVDESPAWKPQSVDSSSYEIENSEYSESQYPPRSPNEEYSASNSDRLVVDLPQVSHNSTDDDRQPVLTQTTVNAAHTTSNDKKAIQGGWTYLFSRKGIKWIVIAHILAGAAQLTGINAVIL